MKLAFLGRDGVINVRRDKGVLHRTKLAFIEGSIEAIASLSHQGFTVVMITHQPALSRGLLDLDELEAIHAMIFDAVENAGGNIAGIFYCGHDHDDHCYCRPPATGLLDVVEIELDCNAQDAWYFCDNEAEAEAANKKGCQLVLLDDQKTLAQCVQSLIKESGI